MGLMIKRYMLINNGNSLNFEYGIDIIPSGTIGILVANPMDNTYIKGIQYGVGLGISSTGISGGVSGGYLDFYSN